MKRETDKLHFLFLMAYLLCMMDALLLGLSTYGEIPHAGLISWGIRGVSALLIFLKLLLDRKYTLQSFIYTVSTGMLLLVSFVLSNYNHMFYLTLIVLGIRNIDIRKVIRIDFSTRLGLGIFIIISSLLGIIENYVTYRTGTQEFRYSLGFVHPNTLASLVFTLILEEAWLSRRRVTPAYMVFVWLISAVIYMTTLNRTSVLLIIVLPVCIALVTSKRITERIPAAINSLSVLSFPVVFLISYGCMTLSKNSMIFGFLDQLLSKRFTNCAVLFNRYGIPLLGQKVELVSIKIARELQTSIALLDVAYLRTLLQSGPIVLALMGCMHIQAVRGAARFKDYYTIMVLLVFLLFGFSESLYNNVYMNFSLLIGAAAMYSPLESRLKTRRLHAGRACRLKRNAYAKQAEI